MPVHLFGQLADMPGIMAVARKHGIPVIEDACQSLGAKGWGKSAGEFGDLTAYSFYPTKNLGAFGDAGMTAIRDDATLAARVRRIRVHGMEQVYMHHEVGMNGRLDEFQGAFKEALASGEPAVIDVHVDPDIYPPFSLLHSATAGFREKH